MRRPRVVVIHPALAPYRLDQFNLMAELFDLTVIFLFDNVWNHPFDQQRLLSRARFDYRYLLKGWEYKGRVFTRWGLLRTLRQLRPDIIISIEFSFATQMLTLMKMTGLLHARLGTMIDDSLAIAQRPQSRSRALARSLIVRHLDFLVVLSREVAAFYQQAHRLVASQLVVAPILQDPQRLRENAPALDAAAADHVARFGLRDRRVVLFVGRLIPEKGVVPFLKHVQRVLRKESDLLFVIVGDGAERPALVNVIAGADLADRVLLPGRYEATELHAWYVCSSGFVLPSLYEPFGAVVNEALAFGLPVMCSSAAGSVGLALDAGGTAFDPNDAAGVEQAFDDFVAKLQPVREARVMSRPSLMASSADDLRDQWSRLLAFPPR